MAKIFISYRRADTTDAAGRMFDRLVATFGSEHVFKDVDSIPLGADFTEIIAERLTGCDVVIVVIGRFWLNVRGQDGTPRLQNPADYVRIEIEQALNLDVVVVPALIGNAAMPREDQLPESLRKLTRKHAIAIRPDPDFHRDMDRLIRALQGIPQRKDKKPETASAVTESPREPSPSPAARLLNPRSSPEGEQLNQFRVWALLIGLCGVVTLGCAAFYSAGSLPLLSAAAISLIAGLTQFGFVFSAGTSEFCRTIPIGRRWAPLLIAGLLMALLGLGFYAAFDDLFRPNVGLFASDAAKAARDSAMTTYAPIDYVMRIILVAGLAAWCIAATWLSAHWPRVAFYQRISLHLVACSAFVIAFSILAMALARGFMAGLNALLGVLSGLAVLFFSLGPVTIWLMMRSSLRKGRR